VAGSGVAGSGMAGAAGEPDGAGGLAGATA